MSNVVLLPRQPEDSGGITSQIRDGEMQGAYGWLHLWTYGANSDNFSCRSYQVHDAVENRIFCRLAEEWVERFSQPIANRFLSLKQGNAMVKVDKCVLDCVRPVL